MKKSKSKLEVASWRAGVIAARAGVIGTIFTVIAAIVAFVALFKPESQSLQSTTVNAPTQIETFSQTNPQNSLVIQGNNIQGNNNVINQQIGVDPHPVESTKPATERSRLLVGRWKGTQRLSTSTHEEIIDARYSEDTGYTELTATGGYYYSGEVVVSILYNGELFEMVFKAQAAGTWQQLNGNKYEVTLSDAKSQPKEFRRHGEPGFDPTRLLLLFPNLPMPKLEDVMLRGARVEHEIVELTQSKLRTRRKDIRGNVLLYEATRQ